MQVFVKNGADLAPEWKARRRAVHDGAVADSTPDGRYIVVDGRRWRATDPGIPDALRQELVAELMDARRQVRTDSEHARPRVNDAKLALGERGEPWWEESSPAACRTRLAASMRALLHHRRPDATICPSDAARVVGGTSWRGLMDEARDVAAELARDRILTVRQGGAEVDPATAVGPIRLGRGPDW